MNTYEVLKECWVNGTRYLPTQLIKLTEIQAKEWLDRKCIKLAKKLHKHKIINQRNQKTPQQLKILRSSKLGANERSEIEK